MLRRVVLVVLLICIAVLLTAQYEGISREELARRRALLNEQAEQIKRETRFQGRISVSPERNRITNLRGRFRDITFPAIDDTLGIERTFDEIVDRIIPFFPVNREDLERINLIIGKNMIGADYRQTANGYRIEGGASLIITYTIQGGSLSINNSLTYLDPSVLPTEPRITREEAKRIFYENTGKPAGWAIPGDGVSLLYCRVRDERNQPTDEFRLSWMVSDLNKVLIIDAISGEVIGGTTALSYDQYTFNVTGDYYEKDDNYALPPPSVYQGGLGRIRVNFILFDGDYTSQAFIHTNEMGDIQYTIGENMSIGEIYSELIYINNNLYYHVCIDTLYSNIVSSDTVFPPHYVDINIHYPEDNGNIYYWASKYLDYLDSNYSPSMKNMIISRDFDVSRISRPGSTVFGFQQDRGAFQLIGLSSNAGKFNTTLFHEITHAYVNSIFEGYGGMTPAPDTTANNWYIKWAMEEAFCTYFPLAYIENDIYRFPNGNSMNLSQIIQVTDQSNSPITEDSYHHYENRWSIASAWWELRNKFDDFEYDKVSSFDELLIRVLREVDREFEYRYRPRYFLNLLMNEVAYEDTVEVVASSQKLNKDQIAIIEAYRKRGMHFVPIVQNGVMEAGMFNERSVFLEGEDVWVRITNLPQNDTINVYLIEHTSSDYIIENATPFDSLLIIHSQVNIQTGNNGEWTGVLWNSAQINEFGYDVVIDINRNGLLDFKFEGIVQLDDRTGMNDEPGFRVLNDGIDVVIAKSPSFEKLAD